MGTLHAPTQCGVSVRAKHTRNYRAGLGDATFLSSETRASFNVEYAPEVRTLPLGNPWDNGDGRGRSYDSRRKWAPSTYLGIAAPSSGLTG